ncbi:LuxR family transcriptional regulator [Pseudonocardia ailaonensis]|uniref:LuxR family transcriptional regulator n=1 Tax=Pseudonocardia ailaonensis TaxID=367279 RepID=A0ABN2MPL5_9PSEU
MTTPDRPPLIGRSDELRNLHALFAAAADGRPGVALVGGEPGVGKSRLVAELAATAAARGALVLHGSAVDVGESPPLLPLRLAVRALARRPEGPAVLDPWRAELEDLGLLPGSGAGREHPLDAASRVLSGLAEDRTVLLVLDDLQWADRTTRDLLTYLTAGMADERLLVVGTHRGGLDAIGLGGLARHPRVRTLPLGPLDRASIAVLAAGVGQADLVWERSGGNAFIAEETLRALRDGEPAALSGTLRDLVLARVRTLPQDARTVLDALSVAEGPVSHDLAGLVTGLPGDRLLAAVRAAVDEGSVVVDEPGPEGGPEGYRLRHGLAVEVVAGALLPAQRRDLHRRYAGALAELTPGADRAGIAALLAHHWDRAGDRERARDAAAVAAGAAERLHGWAEAYRHWRRAADLSVGTLAVGTGRVGTEPVGTEPVGTEPVGTGAVAAASTDPSAGAPVPAPEQVALLGAVLSGAARHPAPLADRALSLDRAAAAAHLAGEHDAAIHALRELIALQSPAGPAGAAPVLVSRLGEYLLAAGRGTEAERLYVDALTGAGRDATAILAGHAEALWAAGRFADAQSEATRALAAARRAGTLADQARILVTLGFSLAYLEDTAAGAAALAEGLRVAEASGSAAVLGRAYQGRAELLSGPLNALAEGIDLALAGATRLGELGLGRTHGVRLLALAANGQFRCGRWDEAVEVIDQAFAAHPSGSEALDIRLSRGRMRVGRGDLAGAGEDLDAVALLAHDTAGARYRLPLLTLRAGLDMFRGRPDEGVGHVLAGLDVVEEGHDDVWLEAPLVWHGLRAHAETVRLDRPPPGDREIARLREHGTALHERAARAVPMVGGVVEVFARMCDAEAGRADGESDPQAWADVAERWSRRDQPYPAAYARLRTAEALLAGRTRNRAAADALAEAHETGQRLGARPFLDEVRDLARRARIPLPEPATTEVPAPRPRARDVPGRRPSRGEALASLTPREGEVLAEIAAGLTNREIAERLFISEKTVGIHVTRLLAKLGVRSRVQAGAVYLRGSSTVSDDQVGRSQL